MSDKPDHARPPIRRRTQDYRVDPYDLQLLVAVVQQGSITAGAREMGLSLAAASERLKTLEQRVGTPLLLRAKAGVRVTGAGRALVPQAHRVLAALDGLHLQMAAHARGLRGTLRLVCNTAALAQTLPPVLSRLLRAQPELDLDVQELSSEAALQALHQGAADAAIVADHVDTQGLQAEAWAEDELVALRPAPTARPAYPSRQGRVRTTARAVLPAPLAFADLLDQPFVGLPAERGLSRFLQAQAARSGRVPLHRVRLPSLHAVVQLVAEGVGVAVLPRSAALRWQATQAGQAGQAGPVAIGTLNAPPAPLALHIHPLRDAWARRRLLCCCLPEARERPAVQALWQALRG